MIAARYDSTGQYYWIGTIDPDIPGQDLSNVYWGSVDPDFQYHNIFRNEPVCKPTRPSSLHDFNYVRKEWVLNEQRAWEAVRERRNALIAQCDWRVLPDAPTPAEKRPLWEAYRAQLRDITKTTSDPLNVVWPEPPL